MVGGGADGIETTDKWAWSDLVSGRGGAGAPATAARNVYKGSVGLRRARMSRADSGDPSNMEKSGAEREVPVATPTDDSAWVVLLTVPSPLLSRVEPLVVT